MKTTDAVLKVRTVLELDAVTVRPGDKLIVSVKALTAEKAAEFRRNAEVFLPGVEVVLIQADQLLVYRPGESDDKTQP